MGSKRVGGGKVTSRAGQGAGQVKFCQTVMAEYYNKRGRVGRGAFEIFIVFYSDDFCCFYIYS